MVLFIVYEAIQVDDVITSYIIIYKVLNGIKR